MKTLEVFDPALSYFDSVLIQFVADLKWVEKFGVKVLRHNLNREPQAFTANLAVFKEMEAGMDRLPVIVVDGDIVSTRIYPSRQQLAQMLDIVATPEEFSPIEAAGCVCTPKFGIH